MAKQLITPNLDPYITQNGVVLRDWLGWCLAYVQTAFGAGWAGATAWDSWTQKTQFKHTNKDIPSGVYVPIWFSHTGTYGGITKNWGHVAIYKDGIVWTSPYSHKPYADRLTIAEVERIFNAKYVGWSEDVAGTKVIELNNQGGNVVIGNGDNWFNRLNQLHTQLLGRPMSREVFNAFVGKDTLTFIETVSDHPETIARENAEATWQNFYNTWSSKVSDLSSRPTKAELDKLKADLAKEALKVQEAEKKLAEEQAKPPVIVEKEPKWLETVRDAILGFLRLKK